MIFKKIRWKNLLSYGNEWTEISLSDYNSNLIIGANGTGKSTLLDALAFVLYNKPFRKVSKTQLLNSINRKNCVVEIEFDEGQSSYKVIRGITPNIFEIYKDGNLLDQTGKAPNYQDILENEILKKSYKTFTQIDVIGSAKYTSFMELTAPQRREVIEDLLDLQIFSSMNVIAKERLSKTDQEIIRLDREQLIKVNELDKIKSLLKNSIDLYNDQIKQNKDKIDEYAKSRNNTQTELSQLEDKFSRLEKKSLADIDYQLNQLTSALVKLKNKISTLSDDISFFETSDSCPTCRQIIDIKFKNDTIDDKKKKIEEYTEIGRTLIEKKNNLETEKASIVTNNNEADSLLTEIRILNNVIAELTNIISGLSSEIFNLEKKIDDVKKVNSNYTNLENEINELRLELNSRHADKDYLKTIIESLKDSGVKSIVIKEYIPIINQLINMYLSKLDFMVSFNLSETFEETIKSRYRDEFSYGSFSEGQKTRINLALLLTFRDIARMRNSVSSNLLIFDEIMDSSLDSQGTDDFLEMLINAVSCPNIFIISHKNESISDKFDRVIEFEMNGNFSKMKVVND